MAAGEQELIERAFYLRVNQNPYRPYYQQSTTWRLIDRIWQTKLEVQAAKDIDIEDEGTTAMKHRRELRQKATMIKDNLPNLFSSLAEYERNINTIIDIAQAHHVRLILMTQPTLYRSDLTTEEQNLLWFGWGGDHEFYYSIEALREGMLLYNERLLEVCRQRQVECLDLAIMLPKDTTVFFDDVHFNESGAEQVAQAVTDYMLERKPFSMGSEKLFQ